MVSKYDNLASVSASERRLFLCLFTPPPFTCDFAIYSPCFKMEAFGCEALRCEGLSRQAPHRGTAMVATAPPEGLLASETEPPWALAASAAAWRPSP